MDHNHSKFGISLRSDSVALGGEYILHNTNQTNKHPHTATNKRNRSWKALSEVTTAMNVLTRLWSPVALKLLRVSCM